MNNNHRTWWSTEQAESTLKGFNINNQNEFSQCLMVGGWVGDGDGRRLASDSPGSPEHHDQPQEPEEEGEEVEVPVELQCVPGLRS